MWGCPCLSFMIARETFSLEDLKSSDTKEQKRFYDRFGPVMYSVAYRICGNRTDAEDVLQDCFLKAFHSIDQFQGKGSLEGWLRKITVHTSINFVKARVRFSDIEGATEIGLYNFSKPNNYRTELKDINYYLSFLTKTTKIIFVLYVFEGYSLKEISQIFNLKESACRCRYMRAKNKLMNIIKNDLNSNKLKLA